MRYRFPQPDLRQAAAASHEPAHSAAPALGGADGCGAARPPGQPRPRRSNWVGLRRDTGGIPPGEAALLLNGSTTQRSPTRSSARARPAAPDRGSSAAPCSPHLRPRQPPLTGRVLDTPGASWAAPWGRSPRPGHSHPRAAAAASAPPLPPPWPTRPAPPGAGCSRESGGAARGCWRGGCARTRNRRWEEARPRGPGPVWRR